MSFCEKETTITYSPRNSVLRNSRAFYFIVGYSPLRRQASQQKRWFDLFAKLDQTGVGQLMEMAISKAKATGNKLHYGICGEHGGDPMSVEFCHKIGLDYVSCSPFRVPIARLAAAQAAIKG